MLQLQCLPVSHKASKRPSPHSFIASNNSTADNCCNILSLISMSSIHSNQINVRSWEGQGLNFFLKLSFFILPTFVSLFVSECLLIGMLILSHPSL